MQDDVFPGSKIITGQAIERKAYLSPSIEFHHSGNALTAYSSHRISERIIPATCVMAFSLFSVLDLASVFVQPVIRSCFHSPVPFYERRPEALPSRLHPITDPSVASFK